ncbi:MAG: PEP-CTERM sorting domain-containing protein [Aquabacterium sp.]|nr:PEP-CTERM sorting domain-containing protein [Aquabacterium sp.]
MKITLSALGLAAFTVGAHAAPVVLNTGLLQMGVNDDASLGGQAVGFVGPTGDAIMPGCLCEGWGAAANGVGNWTYGETGTNGVVSAQLTTTTATGAGLSAQSVVNLANGLQVTHSYSSAAGGALFKVSINLLNNSAATLADVRYARTLDWDVTPGYFDFNYTTVYGGTPTGPGGKVLTTSTNPFDAPNPMDFRSEERDQNVVNSPGDKGGFFVFGFGDIAAGESYSFDTYIGANESVDGLLADLGSVGVEAYSYTTGSDAGFAPAYGYGFAGLGLPPILDVPEPSVIALTALALLGAGAATRRRRA